MIRIENLNKIYKNGENESQILNDINLEIRDGDFLIIMGESGCGKTTLLNCVSGFDKATSGKVEVDGEDIFTLKGNALEQLRLRKFGFIFQDNYLIDNLSVIENVAMSRLQYDKDAYNKAEELLEKVRIKAMRDYYPSQVSGGEKQRCAIARALINDPTVLFADEPTASLDKLTAEEIMELLSALNQNGQTILMVTHSESVATFGTRLIMIENGCFKCDMDLSKMDKEERLFQIQKARGVK